MRNKWLRCLVVFLVLLFEHSEGQATPQPFISLPLRLLLVEGLEVSQEKVNRALMLATSRIRRELYVNIRIIGLKQVTDINPGRNLSNWATELISWRLMLRDSRQLRMIVAPAVKQDGVSYAAGLGYVCFYKTYALSEVFTKEAFEDGTDSLQGIANIMQHELGHQLGALHDDSSINVMHPASTEWGKHGRLSFTDKSKREVRKCLRSFKKGKKYANNYERL